MTWRGFKDFFLKRHFSYGIIIGILLCIGIILFYHKYILTPIEPLNISVNIVDTNSTKIKFLNFTEEINNPTITKTAFLINKSLDNTLSERIFSTNKRVDDILIFGGLIVTLLIAITVSTYVRAEREVERYIKRDFDQIVSDFEERVDLIVERLELAENNAVANETINGAGG
ncbi:hypothetical protein [Edaphocola flava]|uniref:hypothetical protein n=1 Tax=Edaphocola flava TaxID=2499629 RepID=UPI00100AE52C|nr:hypothetical protein [Edaphocola flava]